MLIKYSLEAHLRPFKNIYDGDFFCENTKVVIFAKIFNHRCLIG